MKKELLEKAKVMLSKIETILGAEKPLEMAKEAKLQDGTIVASPSAEFEAGAELFVISEEGAVPAPDGEHTLEDGTIVVVSEGKITEVKEYEEDMNAELASTIASLSERLTALEEKYNASNEENTSLKAELAKVQDELKTSKEEVVKLSKSGAAKSVKKLELSKERSNEKDPLLDKPVAKMTTAERIRYNRLKDAEK